VWGRQKIFGKAARPAGSNSALRYGYRVDAGTAALVGALIGGLLTVIGGLLATLWLARLEQDRETKRQCARHGTAVRIAVLELKHNVATLVLRAAGGQAGVISSAGINAVATDFYSLVPDDLASDVAWAYTLMAGLPADDPAVNRLWIDKIMGIFHALQRYGEKDLGLKFALTGESAERVKQDTEEQNVAVAAGSDKHL
jgi:hypothetical protein